MNDTKPIETLADAFPKEQRRVRGILELYLEIGPGGAFGAHWIRELLDRAEVVALSGDVVEMLRVFEELKQVKS